VPLPQQSVDEVGACQWPIMFARSLGRGRRGGGLRVGQGDGLTDVQFSPPLAGTADTLFEQGQPGVVGGGAAHLHDFLDRGDQLALFVPSLEQMFTAREDSRHGMNPPICE
jgi:hypothetical protein